MVGTIHQSPLITRVENWRSGFKSSNTAYGHLVK
jgi:hypothetical protein